jgi:hypothetical protein
VIVLLQNPKLTLRIGKDYRGASNLSFLKKLPNIRLLDVQNAELLLTFEGGQQRIELTNVNLTLKNFSSKADDLAERPHACDRPGV